MQPFEIAVPAQDGLPDLVLCAPVGSDASRVHEICQDPAIRRWTMVPDTYTLSDARVFVEHIVPAGWESGTELTWALREEQDGGRLSLIGMLGARGCPGGVWEIGYWLAPEARRQAAATRAGHALVGAAFEAEGPMRASTLRWRCRVPNWDSWRVAWKLGFRRDEPAAPTGPGTAGAGGDEWSGTLLPGDSRGPAAPWDGPCSPRA